MTGSKASILIKLFWLAAGLFMGYNYGTHFDKRAVLIYFLIVGLLLFLFNPEEEE